MSGAAIEIAMDSSSVKAMLGRAIAALDNATPAMREIGELVISSISRNFEEGRSPDGSPWKPSRRALKEGGKTLIDTSRLLRSITYQASQNEVTVGTNVVYAALHQLGGEVRLKERHQVLAFRKTKGGGVRFMSRADASKRKTPVRVSFAHIGPAVIRHVARPFLGVRESDWLNIQEIIENHVRSAANNG